MRLLVLLLSLCMPVVAWLDQRGTFGPSNGEVSNRFPTLLVAAGYAFAIWGLIFLLDALHGISQMTGRRRKMPVLSRAAPWTALGFAATTAWMPLFSMGQYAVCVLVIALATLGMVRASMIVLADSTSPGLARWSLPLHAGWLSLATFLNIAQVIVAYRWLPTDRMLPWSLVLLALATGLALAVSRRLRSWPYVLAIVWGLAATYAKQSRASLSGADVAAIAALVAAGLIVLQRVLPGKRRHRR
ncbi:hypothetical protein [Lysobacter sp. HA18]